MNQPAFDVEAIRAQLPALHQRIGNKPLVYLDNAATAQVPQVVVDALVHATVHDRANVHRGVHTLSQRASEGYEGARRSVARFLGAADDREIVFVRGTTEATNLVANAWGDANVGPGDEVVTTTMEHHSGFVPWQALCARRGATLRVIPHDDRGVLDLDAARRLIGPRTRLVSAVHVSNTLGTVNPITELASLAHDHGALLFVDGAQSAPHMAIDVGALGADFFAFSGHKTFGPTGIGALWSRLPIWEAMPPWQTGGGMISEVRLDHTSPGPVPMRFEAGTPNIAGAYALGVALDWLRSVGLDRAAAWEHSLLEHATARLAEVDGLRILGTAPGKVSVVSFVIDGVPPSDLGTLLDQLGIAIRTGHHCTQPIMQFYGVPAAARASFAFYNTREEVDALVDGIHRVRKWL
jgi:cysteine desulfurase/selenocysteine lyase